MARNIVPRTDKGSDLGTPTKRWNTVYTDKLEATIVNGGNLGAVEQSAGDEVTLRSLIATAGSNPTSITIYDDIPITTTNLTIPSNIYLCFKNNGKISPQNGITVTINGTVEAGLRQIFNCIGTGKISFENKNISVVYPEWWGAKGDGVTDDTLACQNALDAFEYVVFSAGKTYLIDAERVTYVNPGNDMIAGIFCNNDQYIYCESGSKFVMKTAVHDRYAIIGVYKVNNVTIYNAHLIGDRSTHTTFETTGEHGHGIYVQESSSVYLVKCYAEDFIGDGFNVDASNHMDAATMSKNINLIDCIATNNRRQGLSVTGGENITIRGGEYKNTNGIDPQSGIDFEPNNLATINVNCLVDGVSFSNNAKFGIMVTNTHNLQIKNCSFDHHSLGHIYTTGQNEVFVDHCKFQNGHVLRFRANVTVEKTIHLSNSYIELTKNLEYSEQQNGLLKFVGVSPYFDGYIYVVNNIIKYTELGGASIYFPGSSDLNKKCVFTGNIVEVPSGFDPSGLIGSNILLYVASSGGWIVHNNTFVNLSTNALCIDGPSTMYLLSRGDDILRNVTDKGFLGQKIVNIPFGVVPVGGLSRKDVGYYYGAKIGDAVDIYPRTANADYIIYEAYVLNDNIIRCIAYNIDPVNSHDVSGDYLIIVRKIS